MVTALKDRTQLEAIDRIPPAGSIQRSRACLKCGGYLFIESDIYITETKCINCGYVDWWELTRKIESRNKAGVPTEAKLAALRWLVEVKETLRATESKSRAPNEPPIPAILVQPDIDADGNEIPDL